MNKQDQDQIMQWAVQGDREAFKGHLEGKSKDEILEVLSLVSRVLEEVKVLRREDVVRADTFANANRAQIARSAGIARTTLARWLREAGHPTNRRNPDNVNPQ